MEEREASWMLAKSGIPASSPNTGPLSGHRWKSGNSLALPPASAPRPSLKQATGLSLFSDPILWVSDGFHIGSSQLDVVSELLARVISHGDQVQNAVHLTLLFKKMFRDPKRCGKIILNILFRI